MAGTKFADVIVPAVFSEYLMEPIREKNALFTSGIVVYDALLASKLDVGGDVFTYPYWGGLTGTSLQAPTEDTKGAVSGITSGKMLVPRIFRTFNAQATAMASILAGSDAMSAIQTRVTEVWRDGLQELFLSILTGVLGAATGTLKTNSGILGTRKGADIVLDIAAKAGEAAPTGVNLISPNAIIDAKQLLGDKGSKFKAVVLHSRVRAELEKLGLIKYTGENFLDSPQEHSTLLGMTVIEDDRVTVEQRNDNETTPVSHNVYSTFLVRADGFRYGDSEKGFKPVYIKDEPDLGMGVETLYTKKMLAFHPLGVSWTPGVGVIPEQITNENFADGANWKYQYDPKLSGFVVLKTNG